MLAPRFAGGLVEPVDPTTEPAPLTSITVDRIAVVSVIGTLVARSGYLDAASGLLSYGNIGDSMASAMDDPSVRGVILDIDSPGGEVGGLFRPSGSDRRHQSRHRQADLGGSKRERAVGGLCGREHCRPALRDADRRSRLGRGGRGSCRRERGRRKGRSRLDIRVCGRKQSRRQRPRAALRAGSCNNPGRRRSSLRAAVRARSRQSPPDPRDRAWNERRRLSRRARRIRSLACCRPPGNARSPRLPTMAAELDRAAAPARASSTRYQRGVLPWRTSNTEQVADDTTRGRRPRTPHRKHRRLHPEPAPPPIQVPAPEPTPTRGRTRSSRRLREEYAEIAGLAAQAIRLGVSVDAADAMRRGISAADLRRSILDTLAARAEATSVIATAPSTRVAGESPIVRRARNDAAAARA